MTITPKSPDFSVYPAFGAQPFESRVVALVEVGIVLVGEPIVLWFVDLHMKLEGIDLESESIVLEFFDPCMEVEDIVFESESIVYWFSDLCMVVGVVVLVT